MDHRIPITNKKTSFIRDRESCQVGRKGRRFGVDAGYFLFGLCTFAVRRAPGLGQMRLGQDGNGMIPLGGLRETRRDEHELYFIKQNKSHTFILMPHVCCAPRTAPEETRVGIPLRYCMMD
jgi:hypothetical protein